MTNHYRNFYTSLLFALMLLSSNNCSGNVNTSDSFLFGISEQFERFFGGEGEVACSNSEITITTREIFLAEDGNVDSSYDASEDNGLKDEIKPATGTIAWGYSSFETCIYPNLPFNTGTLEFSAESNNTYSSRINTELTFPIAVTGDPIPNKFTFSSNGESARQCLKYTVATNDVLKNPIVDRMTLSFGKMIQKDTNRDPVSGNYTNKIPCGITVSLEDDEAPGIRVSNISRVMGEPGPSATDTDGTFYVKLRGGPPLANVTIPINDTFDPVNTGNREGTSNATSLTFTTTADTNAVGHWNKEQAVIINSHDDLELDGMKTYAVELGVTSSSDPIFHGIKPRNVMVYNKDQSVPGFSITRFSGGAPVVTAASAQAITGFATDENNQFTDKYSNFQIKLRTKPTNSVTLNFSSNCGTKCSITTPSLTFTTTDWNVNQTFRVEGASDAANNDNEDYTVSFTITSSDTSYTNPATVAKPTFTVRSCDNDGTALIQPCNFSGSPRGTSANRLSATEGESSHIWLITQSAPASTVTVGLTSTDTSEGTVPASVNIESNNYNVMESASTNRILLSHANDIVVDGPQNWTVTTANSTGGIVHNPRDLFATTTDDEKAFYITHSGSPKEGTADVATVHVCLGGNNPNEVISVTIACETYTAGQAAHGECDTITPPTLNFPVNSEVDPAHASNAGCANSPLKQTFTVSGSDDLYADGSQNFNIKLTKQATTEPIFQNAPNPDDQTLTNRDNEPDGKRVFIATGGPYNGEMTAAGVLGADDVCHNNRPSGITGGTFKALIVSDSGGEINDRLAGGINWVLSAGNYYYRCTGSAYNACSDEHTRLFIADAGAKFNPMTMSRDFSSNISDEFWTGMTNTLDPATQEVSNPTAIACGVTYRNNCHGFTYANCPDSPFPALYGQYWKNNGSGSIVSSESVCTATKKLICVEQ
ncbi:hypothetical protein P3G55_12270 [Leptospira sp. 96542]|nr:hypothetical protein [Leptospira sp. 96542]